MMVGFFFSLKCWALLICNAVFFVFFETLHFIALRWQFYDFLETHGTALHFIDALCTWPSFSFFFLFFF
jgi:hypothetical protein